MAVNPIMAVASMTVVFISMNLVLFSDFPRSTKMRAELRVRHEISVSNISCIWTNCIVPFSVERVGTNIYFFNLFF